MPLVPSTPDLLRSIGLDIDGPARWGTKPTSRKPGIFAVEIAAPANRAPIDVDEVRRWLERVPDLELDGERPTQSILAARMGTFWVPDQTLLYVGRTAKSLSGRVASLYATELGHARPHPGGYWLKTLREQSKLKLWWAETEAPEEYEDEIIEAFAKTIPQEVRDRLPEGAPLLPWANLDSPTGPTRETGLTKAMLSIEETPVKATNVKRSDNSSIKRRASGSSATPRTPRRAATKPGAGKAAAATASLKNQPTHVTAEGLEALHAEMERLTKVERPAVVERVKSARELGDLRENADYEAARNEQSFLEGRILELEQRLRTAVVIKSKVGGSISMGSTVVFEVEGTRDEMTIVGSTESDPTGGKISAASPVGKALLGHHEGDDVVVATPAAEIHYRIVQVK
jgi:transcription elongation factor GreA